MIGLLLIISICIGLSTAHNCEWNSGQVLKVGFVQAELFSYYQDYNNNTIYYGKDIGLLNYLAKALNFQYK